MENHKRVLGIIFVVSAVLQGIFLLVLGFIVSMLLGFIISEADPHDSAIVEMVMHLVQFIPVVVFVCMVVPSLVAGIALLTKQPWGLTLAMIVGCLKLLSFPIGTAIGVYALWVFFEDKKIAKAVPTTTTLD